MHEEKENIHYYNAGGWVDKRLTYVTIDPSGVRIHEYRAQADHQDSETSEAALNSNDDLEISQDAEYENIEN
jgi:hypothetical protein